MTKSQLEQLIDRYLRGTATQQEVKMVDQFYVHMLKEEQGRTDRNERERRQLKNRSYANIEQQIQKNKRKPSRYILSMAAALLIILLSTYLFVDGLSNKRSVQTNTTAERTVEAGLNERSLLLKDGTYVLLSPGTTLSYPAQFNDRIREVELSGQAWFDVKRDTMHPFQVLTGEVVTTVLGTSFSINAYPDSSSLEVKVTSGRVQVNSSEEELAVLEKDDRLIYQSGKVEVARKALTTGKDIEQLPKPGAFKLANVTMAEAARFLEKRWNKEITFENPAIRDCPLYASFNAHDSPEEVLMILCSVSNSRYKMENGKIVIYGKGYLRE